MEGDYEVENFIENDLPVVKGSKSLDEKMKKKGFERISTLRSGTNWADSIPSDVALGSQENSQLINQRRYDELRIVKDTQGRPVLYGRRALKPGEFLYERSDGTVETWFRDRFLPHRDTETPRTKNPNLYDIVERENYLPNNHSKIDSEKKNR